MKMINFLNMSMKIILNNYASLNGTTCHKNMKVSNCDNFCLIDSVDGRECLSSSSVQNALFREYKMKDFKRSSDDKLPFNVLGDPSRINENFGTSRRVGCK
jgi:hypothetical protein